MAYSTQQVRRAFGIFFINIAIIVSCGSVASEIAFQNNVPLYYYVIIWIIISSLIFGLQFRKLKLVFSSIHQRMKNSTKWPLQIKIINGISWALPFVLIPFFPESSQYLILLGISFGNISTFVFMKKFSGLNNKEQLLVGVASLALILPAFIIDFSLFIENQDIAVLLSRLFIAVSYTIGGIYALYQKD